MSSIFLARRKTQKIFILLFFVILLLPVFFVSAQDQEDDPDIAPPQANELTDKVHRIGQAIGFTVIPSKAWAELKVADLIGTVIEAFLMALGAIFLIFMFTAGWIWMTASGDEEKVRKSQAIIKTSIAGIIIVSFAFVLTKIVGLLLSGAGLFA